MIEILRTMIYHPRFRFAAALVLLLGIFAIMGYVPVPDHQWSSVMQRNLEEEVDATPLFYSEVDSIRVLERELRAEYEAMASTIH